MTELEATWRQASRRTTHAEAWAYANAPALFRLIGEQRMRIQALEAELGRVRVTVILDTTGAQP